MTDLAAMRAAILENPDDDGLRLVYADRLIELGDPRGMLISCQLARNVDDDRRWQLEARARDLADTFAAKVRERTSAVDARYERGFLAAITMRTPAFVKHAAALFAAEPVESVTLDIAHDTARSTIARAVAVPGLERVRELLLEIDADHLALFADAPRLRQLHTLAIRSRVRLDLGVLARWPHGALQLLILDCPRSATVMTYVRSPHLRQLRWLAVNSFVAVDLGPIIDALPGVTHVGLSQTPENAQLRGRGFTRAPSPRVVTRETRRITASLQAHWDLWIRN